MKKSEFKKLIKPIVAECIQESLLEGGIISGIIAEVVKGMSGAPRLPIVEDQQPVDSGAQRMRRNAFDKKQTQKLQEQKSKLMSAIGKDAYNGVDLFEGTTPTRSQMSPRQQAGALSSQAPGDPGVDITNLFGSVGRNWGAHMTDVKKGK